MRRLALALGALLATTAASAGDYDYRQVDRLLAWRAMSLMELAMMPVPLAPTVPRPRRSDPQPPAPINPIQPVYRPDGNYKTVVRYDAGGLLSEYDLRWRKTAELGNPVDVLGTCMSACTLLTAHIPKDRLCFGAHAELYFHQAGHVGRPSIEATQWMISKYPLDIRNWILAKGGAEKMPHHDFWMVPAPDLWAMGYRRCPD